MKKMSYLIIVLMMTSIFVFLLMSCLFKPKLMSNYLYTTIDFPGSTRTNAHCINNSGMIVGLQFADSGYNGFLYDGNNFRPIHFPGQTTHFTAAYCINDSGMIVGEYRDYNGNHGFLYNDNRYSTVDIPGFIYTITTGINNSGSIVGRCSNQRYGDGPSHGFLYSKNGFILLDFPGAISTTAQGINDAGTVVGWYLTESGDQKGFLYNGQSYTSFEFSMPDAKYALPLGINNHGLIVGTGFYGEGYTNKGVISDGSGFTTISFPGAKDTYLSSINDKGLLVGIYKNDDGSEHGFIATPSP